MNKSNVLPFESPNDITTESVWIVELQSGSTGYVTATNIIDAQDLALEVIGVEEIDDTIVSITNSHQSEKDFYQRA